MHADISGALLVSDRRVGVPEPLRLVMHGAAEASRLAVVHLWHHLRVPGLIGVSGELDRDGLGAARGRVPVQVLDGFFGLGPLIEADEGHAPRETWTANKKRWWALRSAREWEWSHGGALRYLRPGPPALWSWWCAQSGWTCLPVPADSASSAARWCTDLHLWSCPNSAARTRPAGRRREAFQTGAVANRINTI